MVAVRAVTLQLRKAIPVIVVAIGPVVDDAVAVLIGPVERLDRAGVCTGVSVIAVAARLRVAVPVIVIQRRFFVDRAIAVFVYTIGCLCRHARMHGVVFIFAQSSPPTPTQSWPSPSASERSAPSQSLSTPS